MTSNLRSTEPLALPKPLIHTLPHRLFLTNSTPPNPHDTPQSLFPAAIGRNASPNVLRFINPANKGQFLIYTDGACLDNGGPNPQAGWAFVYKPPAEDRPGYIRAPLENKGPTGEVHKHTSNRAELRAVIAALVFRAWAGEGCRSLVIATDSEYVVEGATSWVSGWLRRDWKTSTGAAVKNRDLWERLLDVIEERHEMGLRVEFWRVPRRWNTDADYHARHVASQDGQDDFQDIHGILV